MTLKLRPQLLQHPNIPNPLHGMAPRVIKGQEWWDVTRQAAYASTDYHCLACGMHKTENRYHKWLEAHEDYTIDYKNGIMTVKEIIPLCHSCHNFIHSGRLWVTNRKTYTGKIADILKHGIKILEDNNLAAWDYTLMLADRYNVEYNCEVINSKEIENIAAWDKWHLILDGQKYYSKFKDMQEWHNYYNK